MHETARNSKKKKKSHDLKIGHGTHPASNTARIPVACKMTHPRPGRNFPGLFQDFSELIFYKTGGGLAGTCSQNGGFVKMIVETYLPM